MAVCGSWFNGTGFSSRHAPALLLAAMVSLLPAGLAAQSGTPPPAAALQHTAEMDATGAGPLSASVVAPSTGYQEAAGASAAGPRKSIIVVCDDNYVPYIFRGSDAALQGILVDMWKAWEARTGIEVTLLGLPWADAQKVFNSGLGDVIDTVFRTPERERIYDFSGPYATIKVPVFVHRNVSGIAKPEDLRGFRVAVKAGDAAADELGRRGVEDLAEFPDYKSIIEAATRGEVRIFCMDEPPALYYLYQKGLDADFKVAFTLNQGQFHRATRKGNVALLQVVENGFDLIPEGEAEAIEQKWMGTNLGRLDLKILGTGVLVVVVLLAGLLSLSWALRRRVRLATAELNDKVRQLEASEARNRAFIAVLPDLVFTMTSDGTFLDVSTRDPQQLFMPAEQFIGRHIRDLGFREPLVDEFVQKLARATTGSASETIEYQLPSPDGLRYFEGRIVPLVEGQALLVVRDMTEKHNHDKMLQVSLMEKEVLLREIHHRVKNNMQVISSLIQLQTYNLHDEADRTMLYETQARIKAMATVHELLYQSDNLSSVFAREYLEAIVSELSFGHAADTVQLDGDDEILSLEEAMPLGLITNELLLNAFKYGAGTDGRVTVRVSLRRNGSDLVLVVADEGSGLPPGMVPSQSTTMGMTLVHSLAEQLHGTVVFTGTAGLRVEFRFRHEHPEQ